jgi:hypothetical protein
MHIEDNPVPTPRAPPRSPIWDDLVQAQKRLLWEYLAWPVVAIALLGLAGYLFIPPATQGPWLVLILLTLAGSLLAIPAAAALGGAAFITYGFWLFGLQLQFGAVGSDIIVLSMMPFAPLWLASLRARQRETIRLDALLQLPQVRAAMEISEWSLLPTARAIERRLGVHLAEQVPGFEAPALIFRLIIPAISRNIEVLGEREMQQAIMRLADDLRATLRIGDMIAEDLREHAVLYILAFPNPANPNEDSLIRRMGQTLARSELARIDLSLAHIPQDGVHMHTLRWHPIPTKRRPE